LHKNGPTLGIKAGDNGAYLHSLSPFRPTCFFRARARFLRARF
jgi:hypothetical protein